jgi:hypothetical protein
LLSVRKAAEFLGIYPDAVYRLVKAKLLVVSVMAKQQACFEIEELAALREAYVFTREIAQKLACNATNLADRIISIGIIPVHGPAIDGGLIYAFRRKDITEDVLQKLSTAEGYQSRTGRGRKRIHRAEDYSNTNSEMLTTTELSKTTGISTTRIRHEAKLGCLSDIVTTNGLNGRGFLFHVRAIGILRMFSENKNWQIKERGKK